MKPEFSFLKYLSFSRVRITFQARETVLLPAYKGSAFRGCFGDALRREVCHYPGKPCKKCPEKFGCAFSLLYNSYVEEDHPHSRNFSKSPHPYIILPIEHEITEFEPGQTFGFELTLIGNATTLFPLLSGALFTMGETGIGKNRGRFFPVSIEAFDASLGYRQMAFNSMPTLIKLNQFPLPAPTSTLALEFETPMRLKEKGNLLRVPPPFMLFTERLAQRLALLAHFHCGAPWEDTSALFQETPDVRIVDNKLRWKEFPRYSGTQDTTMNFDGQTGMIVYEGELMLWLPLISAGTWLHVGLTTTFGLGKYMLINSNNHSE